MRFIFMDEAGTSASEPVTVVVGVIAEPDNHIVRAESMVREALGAVPEQFRKDFVFSAKTVFNSEKFKEDWLMGSRLNLLKSMMSIPRRLGMGLSIGTSWRGSLPAIEEEGLSLRAEEGDHMQAFQSCLGIADSSIRNRGGHNEIASVVAENHNEMKRYLKEIPRLLRHSPIHLKPSHLRTTPADEERGYVDQTTEFRITRIRNTIHWVDKADDPMVQIADACAYGLRRYFAKQTFGEDFAQAVVGNTHVLRNFAYPGGAECYWGSERPPTT